MCVRFPGDLVGRSGSECGFVSLRALAVLKLNDKFELVERG